MENDKLNFGSFYNAAEDRFISGWQRIRRLRQWFLAPCATLLFRLRVSPDMLSFTSLAMSICFCLLAPEQFLLAFGLLIVATLSDGLDGMVARLTHANSAFGTFTDIFCDVTGVAFTVAGTVWISLVHPVLGILFVYEYTTLGIFLVLHEVLHVTHRGVFRSGRTILPLLIGLDFFFKTHLLNAVFLLYLLILPLVGMSFGRLRKRL